jgi:hypothetical protein
MPAVVCNGTTVRAIEETQMKFMLLPAVLAFLMAAGWVAASAREPGLSPRSWSRTRSTSSAIPCRDP